MAKQRAIGLPEKVYNEIRRAAEHHGYKVGAGPASELGKFIRVAVSDYVARNDDPEERSDAEKQP